VPGRIVRLGIDYGTSTSKLVFRDPLAPGGEKTYLVIRRGTLRISSSVAITQKDLVFGCSPLDGGDDIQGRWLESVKMRVAGEATGNYQKYCYGPLPPLPNGFTAKDLAILTVWFLLSEGTNAISRFLNLSEHDVAITATVGIPMSFYEDNKLRTVFLEIVRTARRIYDDCGSMKNNFVALDDCVALVQRYRLTADEIGVPNDELRNWIRSEAEAAMCLAVKSPSVSDGPFAEVDIGAGTTSASIFSILPRFDGQRWLKERLAFFGARSEPFGMDAVDAALARRKGISHDLCLSLRGTERDVFRKTGGAYAFLRTLEEIREAYVMAWRRSAPKLHRPELENFRNHQVFVIGGGSLVSEIEDVFRKHPAGHEQRLRVRQLRKPDDLHRTDNRTIQFDDVPFIVVAYGLTFDAQEMPETFTPNEFGLADRPSRTPLNWEDM
jgi:hypothetical protein